MAEDETLVAARLLLQARESGSLLDGLPAAVAPQTQAAAYAIQQQVMAGLGDIGGWKVGAPGPAAEPSCAPMPSRGVLASPATLDAEAFAAPFIESEIAFRLARDLPLRGTPYSEADIRGAIASCHPAIEVVQSRFADPEAAGALANLADLIRHGAFVWGEAIEGWQSIDFARLAVTQTIGDAPPVSGVGNPAGDMMRLIVWLANEGTTWAGGLRAGQVITCGSWTGMTAVRSIPADVDTNFAGTSPVRLRLGTVHGP